MDCSLVIPLICGQWEYVYTTWHLARSPILYTNIIDLITNIKSYNVLPKMEGISVELENLLSAMLNPDVAERPCLEDIMVVIWGLNES